MSNNKINFAFFGTSEFSAIVLDELESAGLLPTVIICTEDKPVGRKMIITPGATKVWGEKRGIQIFQPKTLREESKEGQQTGITEKIKSLSDRPFDLFIVASYGKIIPQTILDIPVHGVLNVHPSLLPKLRGPSPIQSAILSENETGVSIIVLDEQMDHGPILAQEKTVDWSEDSNTIPYINELETILAHQGGKMLAMILPDWIEEKLEPIEQDHSQATICKKITKEDGLLDFSEQPEKNLRKIRAFGGWPTAYFFMRKENKDVRVIITHAHIENGELVIEKVIPEGKREMKYADFKRNFTSK